MLASSTTTTGRPRKGRRIGARVGMPEVVLVHRAGGHAVVPAQAVGLGLARQVERERRGQGIGGRHDERRGPFGLQVPRHGARRPGPAPGGPASGRSRQAAARAPAIASRAERRIGPNERVEPIRVVDRHDRGDRDAPGRDIDPRPRPAPIERPPQPASRSARPAQHSPAPSSWPRSRPARWPPGRRTRRRPTGRAGRAPRHDPCADVRSAGAAARAVVRRLAACGTTLSQRRRRVRRCRRPTRRRPARRPRHRGS